MRSSKVPVAIALAGIVVAWALYVSMGGTFTLPWGRDHGNPSAVRPVGTEDHILGNPAAPVKVVEYCDFTSDYCKGFHAVLHELVATVGAEGQVAVVYRHFPLHPESGNASALARAAECARKAGGNQGFWDFADELYRNQPVDPSQLGALSQKAALPDKAFADCYADAAAQVGARVEADRTNALQIGATGTPYSILLAKGKKPQVLDGAYTYDALREIVEAAVPALVN